MLTDVKEELNLKNDKSEEIDDYKNKIIILETEIIKLSNYNKKLNKVITSNNKMNEKL